MNLEEKIIRSEKMYKGKIIDLKVDYVMLPDGKEARREVVEHPGGVSVIALTDENELLMVKQFRAGPRKVLLEIPAGKLEYGEDPYACGKRELEEETGYKAGTFEHVISCYSTPGFTDEKLYIYLATELEKTCVKPDEDEFLEVQKIKITRLIEMVENNEIEDAKTIIAILLAKKYLNHGRC